MSESQTPDPPDVPSEKGADTSNMVRPAGLTGGIDAQRDRLDYLENQGPQTRGQKLDRLLFIVLLVVLTVLSCGGAIALFKHFIMR